MYIIDQDKQIVLAKEMKQLRKDSQKYEVYYHHPFTNQMWKSFFPKATEENLGPKLMRHEPLPNSIEACLDVCLAEDAPENAIGLGIEWSAKVSFWPQIVNVLEENYSSYLRGQLKLFLEHLDIGEAEIETINEPSSNGTLDISGEEINNLVWRSRKVRMKRFFVLG